MTDQAAPSLQDSRRASPLAGIALADGAAQVRAASELSEVADSLIPVAPQLKPLFPRGGLERGATYAIRADVGAMSFLVQLLAHPLVQEKWISMVGFSDCASLAFEEASIGLESSGVAGASSGLLRRLVMVPSPAGDAGEVVGAAIDSMDLVVLNAAVVGLKSQVLNRLVARLRASGAVFIVFGSAQGQAELECRVMEQRWFGLGRGQGRLRAQELHVRSRSRRDAQLRECVVEVGQHASYGIEMAG